MPVLVFAMLVSLIYGQQAGTEKVAGASGTMLRARGFELVKAQLIVTLVYLFIVRPLARISHRCVGRRIE